MLYAISQLFRGLYDLTGMSIFSSIASSIYSVERTTDRVKRVKERAKDAKNSLPSKKNNKKAS